MSLFFAEIFEHVHNDKVAEYERGGAELDRKLQMAEPGMLIHAHIKVSRDENETVYRWLEVFSKHEDLQTHMDNPDVQSYIAWLNDGILTKPLKIIIYCDWIEEYMAPLRQMDGLDISFAPLVNGYFRST